MKGKELLDANSKAASLIHDFYLNAMLTALDDQSLPDNFKEFTREKGLPIENIAAMMNTNPRQLFDVFDEQNIYISVYTKNSKLYHYDVLHNEKTTSSTADTRKQADQEAVETAVVMLEKKLISLEKTNEED